jgi:hypothetical protein
MFCYMIKILSHAYLEIKFAPAGTVTACLARSGFKIPDKVQGQGVKPIDKAQHTWVCEHLSEACNTDLGP